MQKALEYLRELVQIPTVSSKPEHHQDLKKGALVVERILKDIGFKRVERWATTTDVDAVFAEHHATHPTHATKTLMLYGHYDVQPVEPLEMWKTPPFELTEVDGWLHARGAEDNKGQLSCVLAALHHNLPPHLNVKILIEGEEESSSRGLYELIDRKKSELKADYLLVFDVDMVSLEKGAVTCGTRGVYGFDIEVKTGSSDLHSGMFGGLARSATSELTYLLSKLLGPEGKILVPGYYDEVVPMSDEEKALFSFTTPTGDYAHYDMKVLSGKDRNYFLPTLEINGFFGGHTGSGSKTVIPAEATAKMSIRTVKNQDGFVLIQKINHFLQEIKHPGVHVTVKPHAGGPFSFTSPEDPFIQTLKKAYHKICKEGCETVLSGASIPVASHLQKASGAALAFAGVGLKEDYIHSPNERFSLSQIEKGVVLVKEILWILGK